MTISLKMACKSLLQIATEKKKLTFEHLLSVLTFARKSPVLKSLDFRPHHEARSAGHIEFLYFLIKFDFFYYQLPMIVCVQYERYDSRPKSESGFSGVPCFFSIFDSSYENSINSRPYPLRFSLGKKLFDQTLKPNILR